MPWAETRTDGPNRTAVITERRLNQGTGLVSTDAVNETVAGVPSRVVNDMTVQLPEEELGLSRNYLSAALEEELAIVRETDRQQLVMPINGAADSAQLNQLASSSGAEYSTTKVGGQTAAVIKPSTSQIDTVTDAINMATAINQGYTDKEVREFLKGRGYNQTQIDEVATTSQQAALALEQGYDADEIRTYLGSTKPKVLQTDTRSKIEGWRVGNWGATPIKDSMEVIKSPEVLNAEELLTRMKVISPQMSSLTTRANGFIFDDQNAVVQAEQGLQASRERILKLMAERDIPVSWNEEFQRFTLTTEEGEVALDDSLWESIKAEKGEFIGGISGGIAGARLTAPTKNPWLILGGSVLGAAGGATVGSQFDYLYQSAMLQEELEGDIAARKAMTAAELSIAGDVLTFGAFKFAGKTAGGVKSVWNGMTAAKEYLVNGNPKGAYQALKELNFMSDGEAQEIVQRLQTVVNEVPGAGPEQQAIAAVTSTRPGAEGLVQAAAAVDPLASRTIVHGIDQRAKDLLKATSELSGEQFSRVLSEDLVNYTGDVRAFYNRVKNEAADAPKLDNFRFDYDALAVQPIIDRMQASISDPALLQRFALQAARVRELSEGRTFNDLLDLRQLVNEFKFNKRITKAKDFDALNSVLTEIDGEITKGAKVVMENPKQWLKDYADARIQYTKMKKLEENVMFKALTKPGVTETQIVNTLSKYINSVDGTFSDLMAKLPAKKVARVENSVIDVLANKYTAGIEGGQRATQFPMLAKELEGVTFTTRDARRMKEAVTRLADVFQNDVMLAKTSGTIQIPKFQSFLTTDPRQRAAYEIASQAFNRIKLLVPGQKSRSTALVFQTAKVLENPLDAKSVTELMQEAAGKVDINDAVIKLQQETARQAADQVNQTTFARFYGDGSVLSPTAGTGKQHSLPVHRLATTKVVQEIAEREGVNPADTAVLDKSLKAYGYIGVQQGTDHVRLIK